VTYDETKLQLKFQRINGKQIVYLALSCNKTRLLGMLQPACHVASGRLHCPGLLLRRKPANTASLPLHAGLPLLRRPAFTLPNCLYAAGLPQCHWPVSLPPLLLFSSHHNCLLPVHAKLLFFSLYNWTFLHLQNFYYIFFLPVCS
jgi:hypothetical protein